MKSKIILLCIILASILTIGCADTIIDDPIANVSDAPATQIEVIEENIDVVATETPIPTEIPTPEPTDTPTPSPVPTETPTPEPDGLISWSKGGFVQREEKSCTEEEYVSDKLHFTVSKYHDEQTFSKSVTYFVTDLYIRDLSCLKTYPALEFNTKDTKKFTYVNKIAKKANALWAMTGDYCGHHKHSLIIRNGIVYDLKLYSNWDLLFLYNDGSMETMAAENFNADTLREDIWQAWQFGPSLLDAEGHAIDSFPKYSNINTWNPRSLIGYIEPGHYIFVTVDGRQGKYSRGLTLPEAAKLMESLGCTLAFNLDGGESAQLYWNQATYNSPSDNGRVVSDIIYLIDED